jgi:acylaminoacyl-peptidase
MLQIRLILLAVVAMALSAPVRVADSKKIDDGTFRLKDVFDLEYASDPRISPDGSQVVYVRNFFDIMNDRQRSNLWVVGADGRNHRPLTSGNRNDASPRWSPDGTTLLYVSSSEGSSQLYLRWMDTGQTAKLTDLISRPGGLSWSPDSRWVAFSMFVKDTKKPYAPMPEKPEGAQWAEPAKVITKLRYRYDGEGYLPEGQHQLFVIPADGGSPRQLTSGPFDHRGAPDWTSDSKALVLSANRHEDSDYQPLNDEVYELRLEDRSIKQLTERKGPDNNPVISPDGRSIAYLGFDDKYQGYQITRLHAMNRDGSGARVLTGSFDRDVSSPVWDTDGKRIYFSYDDQGITKVAFAALDGKVETLASGVGGTDLGRPYASGSFTVGKNGSVAFTATTPNRPADVAIASRGGKARLLTSLNEDLFGHRQLGTVEAISYESSADKRKIEAWVVKPPNFDATKKYPLILEIHGGPFANYGERFAAEIQLYAAAGYVVLYVNPRGSTSYGEEFGNLIHHNYPGQDYDDLISGVDAVLARGYINSEELFVTGGSGGGVLSSWIVGKTNRFRAAVVVKPVINWYSHALTADAYNFFYKYWFSGYPWDRTEEYMKRSPISLAGNVQTPTMLMTGEEDHRTPISEAEQFYQALKLRKVDTALVRVPGASHGLVDRPSRLISKVAHILQWFSDHRKNAH